MKLKNKKTGEIGYLIVGRGSDCYIVCNDEWSTCGEYSSLAELNKEWEDYRNTPYVIDMWEDGCICDAKFGVDLEGIERAKECGLYFETEEEAKEAVDKLKAFKRLEDKGFEFYGWRKNQTGSYELLVRWRDVPPKIYDIINDLKLLFTQEEN